MSHVRDIYENNSSSIYLFRTYNLSVTTIKKNQIFWFLVFKRDHWFGLGSHLKGGGVLWGSLGNRLRRLFLLRPLNPFISCWKRHRLKITFYFGYSEYCTIVATCSSLKVLNCFVYNRKMLSWKLFPWNSVNLATCLMQLFFLNSLFTKQKIDSTLYRMVYRPCYAHLHQKITYHSAVKRCARGPKI